MTKKIDWDGVARKQRAQRHGSEYAYDELPPAGSYADRIRYLSTKEKTSLTREGKVAGIKASTGKMGKTRDQIQKDLIHATFLCLKHSGGTTPFQQILDAVGTMAHRRGIIKWVETFAPVMMRGSKIVLNKPVYNLLNRGFILSDFGAYIKETGMANVKWYLTAKK